MSFSLSEGHALQVPKMPLRSGQRSKQIAQQVQCRPEAT